MLPSQFGAVQERQVDFGGGYETLVNPLQPSHRLHVCSVCGKNMDSKTGLERHIRVHTGEKPYQCPICHHRFSIKSNMTKHFKQQHGQ